MVRLGVAEMDTLSGLPVHDGDGTYDSLAIVLELLP